MIKGIDIEIRLLHWDNTRYFKGLYGTHRSGETTIKRRGRIPTVPYLNYNTSDYLIIAANGKRLAVAKWRDGPLYEILGEIV